MYDSESNEFVGEVEIPVEFQLMSQELHSRMANIVKNKVESWFDSVRNMAKDDDHKTKTNQVITRKVSIGSMAGGFVYLIGVILTFFGSEFVSPDEVMNETSFNFSRF